MAKTRQQKEEELKGISAKIKDAKSLVFVDYTGTNVEDVTTLRQDSKNEGSEYFVVKKTLLDKALQDKKIEGYDVNAFSGNLAVLFGFDDEISPAKLAKNFSKDHENFEILAGVMEGKFIANTEVMQLADLPSREELYAKLVGSINSPVSGFVNVLAGNIRGLVQTLKAISEQKA